MTTESRKSDYKATLCLPSTPFPMKANLAQREPEMLAKWRETRLQERIDAKPAPRGTFILHDGPPYANGHIHLGHALNKILKDIVVRFATMSGYRSPFVPGFDCHGLPIEQKVGEQLGAKRKTMAPLEIRRHCEEYARKWVAVQTEEFQRLGVGGAWDEPYLTIEPRVEAGILRALRDLVTRGYTYKGLKPVFWCATCGTALADAEVEYENRTSPSIYVKFPFRDPACVPALAGLVHPAVVIWTTTPWTLPANLAVSLHPDFEYVALRVTAEKDGAPRDEDWIVARGLVEAFAKDAGLAAYEVVRPVSARELERAELEHPVQPGKVSVVVLGTHVTLEQGTGAVHTAPGHGMEDFIVCQQYGIETVVPVDGEGRFTREFALMEGMTVWEANGPIIRYLDEKDLLIHHAPYEHSYAHCWRCHEPIIYRATEQWFMRVDHEDLRRRTLEAIDGAVQWIPAWGRDRIYNMMQTRPDWCLSRQRSWGVPIPAMVCRACGESTLSPEVIERLAVAAETRGTNAWFEDGAEAFLPPGFACPHCGGKEFDKESNILDVWFDSGSTHISVLEQREGLRSPADLYLEGSDQHRGWFHTSLLVGMGARGHAPYRAVLTHGFLLDGKGEAMSKSKGNVIAPDEVIKQFGADGLRLWVASEDYRGDVKVSKEILARVGEAYRRIRNTIRYLLGNLSDFDPAAHAVALADLTPIDRWVLHELHGVITQCRRAYENYEYHKVYQKVNEFCVVELSSFYLDVLKDRMYCSGAGSPLRRSAQTAQYAVVRALLGVLAPILVFTCDEAYAVLEKDGGSIHLQPFPEAPAEWLLSEQAGEWDLLLAVRSRVLLALEDARQVKKAIGAPLEAQVVLWGGEAGVMDLLRRREGELAELFITSQAFVAAQPPGGEAVSRLEGPPVCVAVFKAQGHKCARCWRVLPDVGRAAAHPDLCERCADVMRRCYNNG
ncbi:MAG: isoleucine--tRNA ligase [Candidatus Sumerlaeaceae bacterium]|nr:isoleucine--tRNA ligase [Candidatus Sumerlaeaceae bacterium]